MKRIGIYKIKYRNEKFVKNVSCLVYIFFLLLFVGNWWGVDVIGFEESIDLRRKKD